MSQPAVAVRPETTLAEAVEVLTQHRIDGAPVVSPDGTLIGVVSEQDLIDVVFDSAARHAPVSQYMTPDVQCVQPGDPLSRAAKSFALHALRRLPVVEDGKLVGMVNCRDLMNHSLRSNELLTEPLLELIPELAQLT
jgi:CBS domain-containing protein